MRRMGWAATAAAIVAVAMGGVRMVGAEGSDNDEQRRFKQCSAATLWGDYGIQIQGTRPAPGGLTESVIGVVLRSYDGNGSFTQVDNVKGSITNTVPDRPGNWLFHCHVGGHLKGGMQALYRVEPAAPAAAKTSN